MKQSDVAFLMMKQWREQFKKLTYEQVGRLTMAIYDYQCDGEEFDTDDPVLDILWVSIKQVFEINNKKYEEMCEKNRRNAKKRVEKYERSQTSATDRNRTQAVAADIDTDIDIEKDIDTDIEIDNDTDKEADTDCKSAASFDDCYNSFLSAKALRDKRIPEFSQHRNYEYKFLTNSDYFTLGQMVNRDALKRYMLKAESYDTDNPSKMILRWAYQDGTLN